MDISKTELEIMQVLWKSHPLCAQDVISELNKQKAWHEKTAKTLLNRLVKKQAISFTKEGKRYLYSPLIAEKDYQQKESASFISRLFKGRVSPLVAGFAKQETLSEQDVEELKAIIADWEKNRD
ncbi:BlaI/MecI/CopY family transcriptional regulator [Planctobacterium marinum]|uniref:BlaI family transcriptional regulator n=1 Tax=Planctobacterium marinum TaxID=1631968 RepID=A0AA48HLL4_9ALTE|nr:BlaI family transcriptional regulator [Planctobacterium marinum]